MSGLQTTTRREICVIRGTHLRRRRTVWLDTTQGPGHLRYARIVLDSQTGPVEIASEEYESGMICLRGRAEVEACGLELALEPYDSVYVPRGSMIRVRGECDLAEISAPVSGDYPLQLVRFADVQRDPVLHFRTGPPSARRDLNILIGKNVNAGRILAGVTFSEPGNWTSWPPHEHGATLEEAYLYIDMPEPAWGLQLVYTDSRSPELITAVREGDCVFMPEGYHPNVAAPGGSINFLWMMAARRETVDREFGVVNVQPEYAAGGSGLEASRQSR